LSERGTVRGEYVRGEMSHTCEASYEVASVIQTKDLWPVFASERLYKTMHANKIIAHPVYGFVVYAFICKCERHEVGE